MLRLPDSESDRFERALSGRAPADPLSRWVRSLRAVPSAPDKATASTHLAAMVAADRDRRTAGPAAGQRGGARLKVALAATAAALSIPLAAAGLAAAGVKLPDAAGDAFEAVGLTLPNQAAGPEPPGGDRGPDRSGPGQQSHTDRAAYGRCVRQAARGGEPRPAAGCASLRPSGGSSGPAEPPARGRTSPPERRDRPRGGRGGEGPPAPSHPSAPAPGKPEQPGEAPGHSSAGGAPEPGAPQAVPQPRNNPAHGPGASGPEAAGGNRP